MPGLLSHRLGKGEVGLVETLLKDVQLIVMGVGYVWGRSDERT